MHSITLTYKWIKCPNLDIKQYVDGLDLKIIEKKLTSDIDNNLSYFKELYDLPNLSLTPRFCEYRDIQDQISDDRIWSTRERIYYFKFGLVYYEISFNTNMKITPNSAIQHMKLFGGKSIESRAIHYKKNACNDFAENEKQCNNCMIVNTELANNIVIFYEDNKMYKTYFDKLTDLLPYMPENRNFYVFSNFWRIQGINQIVLIDDKRRSKPIIESIRWTSALVKGLQDHGDEILDRSLNDLPPYFDNNSNDTIKKEILNEFITKFIERFYLFAPDFLLEKSASRLHLDSRILKGLKYSYECLSEVEKWQFTDRYIQRYIPQNFVPMMYLYRYIRKIPHERFNQLVKKINPHYSFISPNKEYYWKELSEKQIEICSRIANNLLKSNENVPIDKLINRSKMKTYSATQITELLGHSKGAAKQSIDKEIEGLSKRNILLTIKSNKIGKSGPPHDRYYLNPEMPYTQYFLHLHLTNLPEQELEEITIDIFSKTNK